MKPYLPIVKVCLILGLILLTWVKVYAQKTYGFEWIRPYQPYLKFTINQKGIYRIDSASLANWAGKDPRKFQLFCKGKEQAIFVSGESDGKFNSVDFIEFYAEPNNGMLDEELFRTPEEQAQKFRSMFSDTAVYFLTILPDTVPQGPKRIQNYLDNDYNSFTPEPTLVSVQHIVPQEDYYYGAFLPSSEKYYISEYGDAEGMASSLIGQGQGRFFTFQTPHAGNAAAQVEVKVIGASDYYLENPNLPNHHLRIWVHTNNSSTGTLLVDTTFRSYGERKFNRSIAANLIGDSTRFLVEVVNDIAVGSDFIAVSYLQLSYTKNVYYEGLQAEYVLNPSQTAAKTLLQVENFSSAIPLFWDLKNNIRVVGAKSGNRALALFPYTAQSRNIFFSDINSVSYLSKFSTVNFVYPNPADAYEYLLVSNKILGNAAESYKTYREKKYHTYLAYSDDLSDYFFYGYFHPLAIRRFAQYLFDKQVKAPQFILLLGRGYQHNLLKSNPETNPLNLVPSIGIPSSDNLFTAGFLNNTGAPAIATGRVPANSNQEAANYLQKITYYETSPDSIQPWRKNYLHLSGGAEQTQQNSFRFKLNSLAGTLTDKPTGANVFAYYKNSTKPTDGVLKEVLLNHLNSGVNMMTFYGHGSLTVLDMDFGGINDLLKNNRCAFYYFNGCNIGNANDVDPQGSGLVYGKDYICSEGKGAIGWLAHTNLTFTNHLENQMDQLYEQLNYSSYGTPIGIQLRKALEFTNIGNENFARSHALQLLLQGDPALVLFAPSKPDYKISQEDLFVFPSNATVQSDSLAVGIILHNLGKARGDSLNIKLNRKLPDNSSQDYTLKSCIGPYYQDTFYVWIKSLDKKDIGNNIFTVQVNPDKMVDEISYQNNEAVLSYFIPGSGIQMILPYAYQIVSNDSIELLVQNNNLFSPVIGYIFEIDTGLSFSNSSSFYQNSGTILSSHLASWKVKLKNTDSMVYYWRAKLDVPVNEGGVWSTQSFTAIKDGPNGWQQQRYEQIRNAGEKTFINFNDSTRKIEFSDNELALGIENRRWDHRRMGVIIPYLLNALVGNCMSQGTVVLVFEPFQMDFPYELPNYPFNCAYIQQNKSDQSLRYYPFNTNVPSGEAELARLIDSVPNGYYVAMFSRYNTNIPNWSETTKALFGKIGSVKVQQVKSTNTAWAVIGKKGEAPGLAVEDTVNNNEMENVSSLPPQPNEVQDEKYLRIRRNIKLKWFTGNFISTPIGPAKKFKQLDLNLKDEDPVISGRWWLNLYATDKNGVDTLYIANSHETILNLELIDANRFPYIKLQLNFVDSQYRSPQQINFWQVSYDGVPELSINPSQSYQFHAETINKGDSLMLQLPISNLSVIASDSTKLKVQIMDENRTIPYVLESKIPPLKKGETYLVQTKISTRNLGGNNTLLLNVNEDKVPQELSFTNNFYKKNFQVKSDQNNPLLEVTFDGQRIMNGDIVSPSPVIGISSTDKNAYLLQKDTNTFELYLRRPKNFDFERIYLNANETQFFPADANNQARLIYTPKNLPDGLYTLKTQAIDASGNKAGNNDFEIDFNVINKSSITYFYPYPNPFSTQMRFVFTLTGSKIPEQLMVRIFTINGKLVREIRKDEFGPIHIGNNISEFAWDGSDMYGDKLANGVYLYQVYTQIDGKEIENRATKAKEESKFFVNGTGKIFLMR